MITTTNKKETINLSVKVNTDELVEKVNELASKLKEVNSLYKELTSNDIPIEIKDH